MRVQVLIRHGRLPAQKVGRNYVINEDDLKLVKDRKPGRPLKRASKKKAVKEKVSLRGALWEENGAGYKGRVCLSGRSDNRSYARAGVRQRTTQATSRGHKTRLSADPPRCF
jgi:hypothetical protein